MAPSSPAGRRPFRLALLAVAGAVVIAAALMLTNPGFVPSLGDGPPIAGHVAHFVPVKAARPGPDLAWRDAEGNEMRLGDFRGRVVLINFWATWCIPCVRELPSMDRLQTKLGGSEFTVLAVNVDAGGKYAAEPFLAKLSLAALPLYLDQRAALSRAMGVSVMPTSILYDRNGRELGRLEGGAEWDSADALALVRYFLARKS